MSSGQAFDAIVVGAGPAGCACSYRLAKEGLNVLLVERGKFAGAKNMWGGAFFGPALHNLIPDFGKEAPIERFVARHRLSFLSGEECLSIEYASPEYSASPYEAFIALRAKFDKWLVTKVEEAGGIVATGLQAEDLLWDGSKIVGIKAGKDEIPCNVVVACDGVNSLLAQKAKLRGEIEPQDAKQGVKEVIALPREVLERRLGLNSSEGISWQFIGNFTRGVPGGAFIYSNRESLSVGIVVLLSSLKEKGFTANDLLEDFEKYPVVAGLLEGGRLVEYSGHLIPTSAMDMMPALCTNGFLVAGDAAAFVVGTGLILEGANFAISSGMAAADAVIKAKKAEDYSAITLSCYQKLLEQSFVLKDLRTYRKAHHFLENPRIYTTYPELLCEFAAKIFTSDGEPRKRTWNTLRDTMKGKVSIWQVARDMMQAKEAI